MKLFLLSFLLLNFSLAQDSPEKEIEVELGIDKIEKLDFAYSTKVQIGNDSVLQLVLAPQKREMTFRGIKEGKTSVTIRNTVGDVKLRYIVNVKASANSKTVSELRDFLDEVEGIDIVIKGGKVVVEGYIVVPEDIGLVSTVLSKYPDVIRLIELSPQTQRVISKKIKDELVRNGLKDVNVRIINKTFWLEGVVGSNGQKQFAQQIAEAYIPDKVASLRQRANETDGLAERPVIINFLSVNEKKEPPPAKKMIKVTTQFVELSKDYVKQFGFQWAPLLGQDNSSISIGRNDDGSVTSNSSNTLSATISNLFPKLQTFKEAGYARVIQSGMVIVTDGEKDGASLEKSTTTNLAVGNGETQRAVEANIGFTLKVNAQVLDQERIEVGVNFNVTLNAGTSGAPVESRNVINTKLVIKSKESAAIGGVVQGENRTAYDKNPPFGGVRPDTQNGITPLFDLRKSKSFLSSKNQFVMFLTPEIVASAAEGTREIRKKFRKRSR